MAKRKTARSGGRQPEAIAMLIEDHQKVQKLFRQFEKTENAQQREQIAKQVCDELVVHTQLEEQVFYPAARQALEESELVNEATVEHQVANDLIEKLKGMNGGNGEYAATFTVLGEYVNHHISEEQDELFPAVRKSDLDFEALAEEMQQRKKELQDELGMDSGTESPRSGTKRQSRRQQASRSATR